MRYEGVRKSRRDPEIDVYVFAMGVEEMRLMRDITTHYYKTMPKLFEVQPVRQRLKAMRDGLDQALQYYQLSKRNIGNANIK